MNIEYQESTTIEYFDCVRNETIRCIKTGNFI